MELSQLNYFRETAKHETFSKAAQALHITQPALSKSIAKLEQELGCRLFERGPGPLQLTGQGRTFLYWCGQAQLALDSGIRQARDLSEYPSGPVRVATSEGVFLKHLVRDFLVEHEQVDIICSTLDSEQIARLLSSGELDFAVTRRPVTGPEIYWHPVCSDRLTALMSVSHPLAGRTSVSLSELAEEHFLVGDVTRGMKSHTLELCQRSGFTPRIRYQGHESDVGSLLVSLPRSVLLAYHTTTLGVRQYGGSDDHGVVPVPISDRLPEEVLGIAMRGGRSQTAAACAFYDVVDTYFRSLSGQSGSFAP